MLEAANEMIHFQVPWFARTHAGCYFVWWLRFGLRDLIKLAAALRFLSPVVLPGATSLMYFAE